MLHLCVQQRLHATLEQHAQMQKELTVKDERIKLLESKNGKLIQIIDEKTIELEALKQKASLLEQEVSGLLKLCISVLIICSV